MYNARQIDPFAINRYRPAASPPGPEFEQGNAAMTPMLKRLLSASAAAATLSVALLVAPAASAVVLNITGSSCSEYALSAPDANGIQTLSCKVGGVPSCSISGASSAQINTSVTLTATCSPGTITQYQWTGGCTNASPTTTCTVTSASAALVPYTVTATNATGPGNAASKSVNWTTAAPTALSGCTLVANPTTTTAGGSVDLTAGCTTGGPVTKWTWTSPYLDSEGLGISTNRASTLQAGSYTFLVTMENASGSSASVSTNVTVSGTTTGGGGTPGTPIAACSGFRNTKVMDIAFLPDGGGDINKYVTTPGVFRTGPGLSTAAGFGKDDALVVVFTAPATIETSMMLGVTHSGGATGSSSTRTFVLSKTPCDFAIPASADAVWADQANVMSQRLSSGITVRSTLRLEQGREYYLNVKNTAYGGTVGCGVDRCDVFVTTSN